MGKDADSVVSGSCAPSSTSSQKDKAKKALGTKKDGEDDLLAQKKTVLEAVFTALFTLSRDKIPDPWQYTVVKIVLEGLIPFLVIFNTTTGFSINESNWLWQYIRWIQLATTIPTLEGYDMYLTIMYVFIVIEFVLLAGVIGLTIAIRKSAYSKWLKLFSSVLQVFVELTFVVLYMVIFDYFAIMFSCTWDKSFDAANNPLFPEVDNCWSMPYLAHMIMAAISSLIFFFGSASMLVAGSDVNPTSRGVLASPEAVVRLQILVAKALFVISAHGLYYTAKVRTVFMMLCVIFIVWVNLTMLPFYSKWVNCVWVAMWSAVMFACSLNIGIAWTASTDDPFDPATASNVLLYAVWPMLLIGAGICHGMMVWKNRPLKKFIGRQDLASLHVSKLRRIHKFSEPAQCEILSRAMRKFDRDGVIDPDSAALGEVIIKAGMATFPNSASLYILYANFLLVVRADGPSSRSQLQFAQKSQPHIVETYQIFCATEAFKRMKDTESSSMDLHAYVEFKKMMRSVIKVHRGVMQHHQKFWSDVAKKVSKASKIQETIYEMETQMLQAKAVYRRVLEQYPTSGRLCRLYGKFLEDICSDIKGATKYYHLATKLGMGEGLASMDVDFTGQNKPEFLTSMDLREDAVVVMNAEGILLMFTVAFPQLFGYTKPELEGANVSMLMPQPFSGQHNGYLQRYTSSGDPHILDSVREVVGLHKERTVFPLELCVTKLSGMGADCVFLAVLRPVALSAIDIRVWVAAASGTILCAGQHFASLVGKPAMELMGHTFHELALDQDAMAAFISKCKGHNADAFGPDGPLTTTCSMHNRYLPPVPCNIWAGLGGTDKYPIYVIHLSRMNPEQQAEYQAKLKGEAGALKGIMAVNRNSHSQVSQAVVPAPSAGPAIPDSLLVMDIYGGIIFATWDLSAMLGHNLKALLRMNIDNLIPMPWNSLHRKKYLLNPPHKTPLASCRTGQVVNMVTENGQLLPVRVAVRSSDDTDGTKHIVSIRKATHQDFLLDKRILLTLNFEGKIEEVEPRESWLFGFPSELLLGRDICSVVDVFASWREKNQGEENTELLLLALLDKEQEVPGTSWRVKVMGGTPEEAGVAEHDDGKDGWEAIRKRLKKGGGHLDGVQASARGVGQGAVHTKSALKQSNPEDEFSKMANKAQQTLDGGPNKVSGGKRREMNLVPKSAVMMVEPTEGEDGTSHIRVQLWRREFLTGNIELSDRLNILRADESVGLIVGVPNMLMIRQPLHKYIDVPAHTTWHSMMETSGSRGPQTLKGALKGGFLKKSSVSKPMFFEGPHPDGGSMRLMLQGMEVEEKGKLRVYATLKADVTFVGAHAKLFQVLGLERTDADTNPPSLSGSRSRSSLSDDKEQNEEEAEDEDAAAKAAAMNPDSFVSKWVRTLSLSAQDTSLLGPEASQMIRPKTPVDGEHLEAIAEMQDSLLFSDRGSIDRGAAEVRGPKRISSLRRGLVKAEDRPGTGGSQPEGSDTGSASRLSRSSLDRGGLASPAGPAPHGTPRKPVHPLTRMSLDIYRPAPMDSAVADMVADMPDEAMDIPRPKRKQKGEGEEKGGEKGDGGSDAGSSDGGSEAGASQISSSEEGHEEILVDARRARLLKKLALIVDGPGFKRAQTRIKWSMAVMLFFMLFVQIICVIVIFFLLKHEDAMLQTQYHHAVAIDHSQQVIALTRDAAFCQRPGVELIQECEIFNNLDEFAEAYLEETADWELFHDNVYFGNNTGKPRMLAGNAHRFWTERTINHTLFLDSGGTLTEQAVTDGLMTLGSLLISAARDVEYLMRLMGENVSRTPQYQSILENGPNALYESYIISMDMIAKTSYDETTRLKTSFLVLLVINVLIVQLSGIVYILFLVRRAECVRLVELTALIGLPGHVMRMLQSRVIVISGDSDDDNEAESDNEAPEQAKQAAAVVKSADTALPKEEHVKAPLLGEESTLSEDDEAVAVVAPKRGYVEVEKRKWYQPDKYRIHGRELIPSYTKTIILMTPVIVWFIALLVVYILSFTMIDNLAEPLATLDMSLRNLHRFGHVRNIARQLVTADTDVAKEFFKEDLTKELRMFESEYYRFMYGGSSLDDDTLLFNLDIPAGAFTVASLSEDFFRSTGCFRWNQENCYDESSMYYEITHHGLDSMTRRLFTELRLLLQDDNADIVHNSTRYDYVYYVGTQDLYEGLRSSSEKVVSSTESALNSIFVMHMIALVVALLIVFLYMAFMIRHYLRTITMESTRVQAMLSNVPRECDVVKHTAGVYSAYDIEVDTK